MIWATTWQNQQNECAPSEVSDQPGHPLFCWFLSCRDSSEKLQSDKFDLRKKGKRYRMLICTELVLLTITAITSALWRIKAFRTVGTLNLSEHADTEEVLFSSKSSSLLVIKCAQWLFASSVNRQELHHDKTCLCHMRNNKEADQPSHPRSLSSVFVVCSLDSMILKMLYQKFKDYLAFVE